MATGTVLEVQADGSIWLACPGASLPSPGQYLHAWSPADPAAPIPAALFAGGLVWKAAPEEAAEQAAGEVYLRCAPPVPINWGIGSLLKLFGPLGRGFDLPGRVHSLALVSVQGGAERLLPLIPPVLDEGGGVALFSDETLPQLPLAVEAYPLAAIAELRNWPDFFVFELPFERLPELRDLLELPAHERLPAPAQALVDLPMPCGGLADCGACTVSGRFSGFLACKDGPVFDLERLEW
jgi:hypothetical protein